MICPYCKDENNVVKRGLRRNKYVVKQQYWCKKCTRYFVEHDGFEGMTYPLGKTPAEEAELDVPLGRNRLLGLCCLG